MFRKLTLVAIPAAAFALTLFASVDSTFAKGGKGAPNGKHMGMGREHRERGEHRGNWRKDCRYNRYFDRFSFGYPTFGCVEAPVYGCEVVTTPVVTAPVVEAPLRSRDDPCCDGPGRRGTGCRSTCSRNTGDRRPGLHDQRTSFHVQSRIRVGSPTLSEGLPPA
jgi:hypothetical protein